MAAVAAQGIHGTIIAPGSSGATTSVHGHRPGAAFDRRAGERWPGVAAIRESQPTGITRLFSDRRCRPITVCGKPLAQGYPARRPEGIDRIHAIFAD